VIIHRICAWNIEAVGAWQQSKHLSYHSL